jgi:LmbE family N-acetylglucosaminyl deacetylase
VAGVHPTTARAARSLSGEASALAAVTGEAGSSPFVRGVSVLRDWPSRAAVVVGRDPHPQVLAALREVGFTPVVTTVDDADDTVGRLAPFGFLIIGPDVLDDDERIAAVRSWHRCSPSARLKLVCPHDQRDPEVLLRAIRAGVNDVLDPDDPEHIRAELRAAIVRAGVSRERVLAIGAHPDDVEIGAAGTLLDHRRRGDRISILTLSRGAVGGDQDDRVLESCATADRLGAQLLFADLPDTAIDSGIETIRLIEDVVRVLDPTVVYVHSIHDNHQDHRAVSEAARSATRGVRRVFAYQSPSATNDFRPTQFVRIDQTLAAKIELLQLFASQEGRNYLEPELVSAGARYWARHLAANARYAEPFEVVRSVGELRLLTESPTFEVEFAAASAQVRTLTPVPATEAS